MASASRSDVRMPSSLHAHPDPARHSVVSSCRRTSRRAAAPDGRPPARTAAIVRDVDLRALRSRSSAEQDPPETHVGQVPSISGQATQHSFRTEMPKRRRLNKPVDGPDGQIHERHLQQLVVERRQSRCGEQRVQATTLSPYTVPKIKRPSSVRGDVDGSVNSKCMPRNTAMGT